MARSSFLQDHPSVDSVDSLNGTLVVKLKPEVQDYSDLPTLLISNGHRLTLFKEDEVNLETAFMALTKGITS